MAAAARGALARWRASLERLAELPPQITGGLLGPRLLADVARVAGADTGPGGEPVDLRVVLLWAAPQPPARVTSELGRALDGSVPGAWSACTVLHVETASADDIRYALAGAHAVAAVVRHADLVVDQPGAAAARRREWLARCLESARQHPGQDRITVVVDGDTPRRTDAAGRRDRIEQDVAARLGMELRWTARGVVETGIGSVPPSTVLDRVPDRRWPPGDAGSTGTPGVPELAARLTQPYRDNLDQAYAEATAGQARHALWYIQRRCAEILDVATPAVGGIAMELRWIWLHALAGGKLAETVGQGLDAAVPPAAAQTDLRQAAG
jgi:hypothetical protein